MSSNPPVQYTAYAPATTDNASVLHQISTLYQNHYPNVPLTIPIAGQPTSSYYNPYPAITAGISRSDGFQQPQQQLKQTNPAPARPPSPPEPAITPAIAQQVLRRLIGNELMNIGFESADGQSLRRLEVETVAYVQQLFGRAHEYANLANRAGIITSDLLLTLNDFGIVPKELYLHAKKQTHHHPSAIITTTPVSDSRNSESENPNKGSATSMSIPRKRRLKRQSRFFPTKLTFSASRSSSPDLLASDDESGPPIIPTTLRGLPPYFPQLPPKHTYLQTPASPPKKAALPSLEKKLKTASLVQESLRNLLLATEDSTGQEDAELLGHIVNWETGLHPRKRWKVGGR